VAAVAVIIQEGKTVAPVAVEAGIAMLGLQMQVFLEVIPNGCSYDMMLLDYAG